MPLSFPHEVTKNLNSHVVFYRKYVHARPLNSSAQFDFLTYFYKCSIRCSQRCIVILKNNWILSSRSLLLPCTTSKKVTLRGDSFKLNNTVLDSYKCNRVTRGSLPNPLSLLRQPPFCSYINTASGVEGIQKSAITAVLLVAFMFSIGMQPLGPGTLW